MVDLEKRATLVGIGLTLAELALPGCIGFWHNKEVAAQRQKLIDRIAQGESLPNLGNPIYDYDGSRGISRMEEYLQRALRDPKLPEYLMAAVGRADAYGRKISMEQVMELLNSPAKLEEGLRHILVSRTKQKIKKNHALTLPYPFDYACICKSDVHIFWTAFEKFYVQTKQGIAEIPTEEVIRYVLRHEGVHTDQIANGIRLTNQLFVDGSNFFKIHPDVIDDLAESDAYLKAFEKAQALGKGHPQYLLAFASLQGHALSDSHIFVQLGKTEYELQLLDAQNQKVFQALMDNRELYGTRVISK